MIYLDHAAATPMYPEVQKVLTDLLGQDLGNPSSIHTKGREAKALIDEARYFCAHQFRAELDGVIFTSGATEAAHLAIVGSYLKGNKKKILVSPLVHKCIWSAISFLQKHFGAEYEGLELTEEGFIDVAHYEDTNWSEYSLVICEHGNSEFGHLQPVAKIGRMLEKFDPVPNPGSHSNDFGQNPGCTKPTFIVDAAASMVTEDISLEHLKADLFFFSGEKFGGPSGVGALLKKEEVILEPLVHGSHEFGNRGGTENVLGIVGMYEALKQRNKRREDLRDIWMQWHEKMRASLSKAGMNVTTPEVNYLPHVIHFVHPDMNADLFVQKADLQGVCLSAGSACSSGTITGSKALQRLGYSEEASKRGIRISWGWDTTSKDFESFETFIS